MPRRTPKCCPDLFISAGYARRHYTHDEVERLAASQGVDIVLTHDAPAGVCFQHHRRGGTFGRCRRIPPDERGKLER